MSLRIAAIPMISPLPPFPFPHSRSYPPASAQNNTLTIATASSVYTSDSGPPILHNSLLV